ncbi:radical SAM family heme chaperone HemW [Echinicola sediminis]
MVAMICKELVLRKDYLPEGHTVETVYFGGGTPSLLSENELSAILQTISLHYQMDLQELTIEANPDDLTPDRLRELKSLKFDRLSIGIQSFHDEILKYYNRAHNAKESIQCIDMARNAGFEKLSIDLMYGFPHADHQLWIDDLQLAISHDPGHISSYCLTVEPGTTLGNWEKKGKFLPASEDFCAEQFEIMQERLGLAGYVQYEISNFGNPGAFAVHNTNYWKGVPYLGVGPSAHSFDGQSRQHNIANNAKYIKALEKGDLLSEKDLLSPTDIINEYLLTSLRTIWGTDLVKVKEEYDTLLLEEKHHEIRAFQEDGLLEVSDEHLRLTKEGKLLADYIAGKLFL